MEKQCIIIKPASEAIVLLQVDSMTNAEKKENSTHPNEKIEGKHHILQAFHTAMEHHDYNMCQNPFVSLGKPKFEGASTNPVLCVERHLRIWDGVNSCGLHLHFQIKTSGQCC